MFHYALRDNEQSDLVAGPEHLEDILNIICDRTSVVHHRTNVKHHCCHLSYGEIKLLVSPSDEVDDAESTQVVHRLVTKEVNSPIVASGAPNLKYTLVDRSKAQKSHLLVCKAFTVRMSEMDSRPIELISPFSFYRRTKNTCR